MASMRDLHGSCNCGRYNYVVMVPENYANKAQVYFATDGEHRRNQAALLTAFLRVPLSWYQSHTISFFPDESHNSISRTFTPLHEPHCQRKFCGYCGTHLSYWTEGPEEEQDYLHVTIGSLRGQDIATLEQLDILPEDVSADDVESGKMVARDDSAAVNQSQNAETVRSIRHGTDGPMTWFEEMLDGSRLGRATKTRRGAGTSADGTTSVQWEVTQYGEDDTEEPEILPTAAVGSKRKIGDVAGEDSKMVG